MMSCTFTLVKLPSLLSTRLLASCSPPSTFRAIVPSTHRSRPASPPPFLDLPPASGQGQAADLGRPCVTNTNRPESPSYSHLRRRGATPPTELQSIYMELVTGAVGSLLPKLGELLKEEYGLQKGVRKKIESLSRELEVVHAVLRKIADVPPDQLDDLVRLWVRDVREASYDMEDIVDAFLVRVDDGAEPDADPHMLRRLRKKVGGLFKKSKARRKISTLIQDIREKLEEVAARRGRYTTDNIIVKPVAATTIDPRLFNLYKRATELVGIDGPKDELINKLSLEGDHVDVPDKKIIKIISIFGFGGLGKTTLAKAVYDQIKLRFERSAFVPVGRNPDMKKVFRDILIGLEYKGKYTNSDLMVLDEKQLIDELKEFVEKKRCFIVIDDMWDKESWKLIGCALQGSNCGSRVVITTRIYEVATHAGEAYKMQPLSHENSEKLLYARIADGEEKYFDSPIAEACDKILKKCGGVPLAIITIASLLASKPGEDWSHVYNSIGFGSGGKNDDVENTRRILSFSYYDLPSHLKPCLLYLSIYSEDQFIDKIGLIWKWIAEGFIHEEEAAGVGIFELGEQYFNELINRSMIQPMEDNNTIVYGCRVHDMVFDLVRTLSSQENFVTVLEGHDWQKHPAGSTARRLALQRIQEENGGRVANITMDKVRSLIGSQCNIGLSCPRISVLRVLDMDECYVGKRRNGGILDHIGSFPHLRYLRLGYSRDEDIKELPREVGYLKFLQTLDLQGTSINKLPEDVGLLTQLVCLNVNNYFKTRVPTGLIGKLTSLQELRIYPAGDNDDGVTMQFVKDLGMLRELRVLRTSIMNTSESMGSALAESLGNLQNIQIVDIAVGQGRSMPIDGTRHAGLLTCRHLQYLRLSCFKYSALSAWIKPSLARKLSYLEVEVLVVKEQDMETLGRLPELRCLKLYLAGDDDTKSVSIKIPTGCVGYFRKLRILRIDCTPISCFDVHGCECNSSVASAIMPSLESLEFRTHVRFLKDAALLGSDRLFGFEHLGRTSLQRVTVDMKCQGARIPEVEEMEAVLERTATVHPNRPTLQTKWLNRYDMPSPYQEACMDDVSRTPDFIIKAWKLVDIIDSGHIRALRMPDPAASSSKVIRLLYTSLGEALWALTSNAVLKLWEWGRSKKNRSGMSTTSVPPQLGEPKSRILATNDTTNGGPEEAAACITLHNDEAVYSASSGRLSYVYPRSIQEPSLLLALPSPATFLAVYPQWDYFMAIGMEDCSIQIYDDVFNNKEAETVLMGHQKKITGLAFSTLMNVLVSSDADAQLCVWNIDGWEKKKSRYIQPPSNASGGLVGDTMVQFHYDRTHLLVTHESHLAIYDGNLECLQLWFPRDALPAPISSAVYSSDGLMIYATFRDGAIGIFKAESLALECRIAPSAYIPSSISSGGGIVYPMAVDAHPRRPNQMAVGMNDGAVYVLEPLEN